MLRPAGGESGWDGRSVVEQQPPPRDRSEPRDPHPDRTRRGHLDPGDPRRHCLRPDRRLAGQVATRLRHAEGTTSRKIWRPPDNPFSSWMPASWSVKPEPSRRSFVVEETATSSGPASDITRAAAWTAIPR